MPIPTDKEVQLKAVEDQMRVALASAQKLCREAGILSGHSSDSAVALIATEIFRRTHQF